MNPQDRKLLEQLKFSPEVISRAGEVLKSWGVEELFAVCSFCQKPCLDPDLPKGKHLRKKLPAELFWRRELLALRDGGGEVVCWPCDDFQFERG